MVMTKLKTVEVLLSPLTAPCSLSLDDVHTLISLGSIKNRCLPRVFTLNSDSEESPDKRPNQTVFKSGTSCLVGYVKCLARNTSSPHGSASRSVNLDLWYIGDFSLPH